MTDKLPPHVVMAALRRHGFDCYSTTEAAGCPAKVYGVMPYTDALGQLQFAHVEVERTEQGIRDFLGY